LLVSDQRFGLRTDGFAGGASDEWRATELQIHRDRGARLAEIAEERDGALHHPDATVSASYEGGLIEDDDFDFTPRFWRLCQQRIPVITRYKDEPGTANASARIADTRIIQLRGWDPPIGKAPVGEVGLPALVGEVSFEPDVGGPRPFLRFGGDEPCSEEPSADRGR